MTKHTRLYPIESYHREIKSLLGLPTDGHIETFVDTGQIFLKNAANATELPGVDFTGLNDDQKKHALHRMNAETCTCGCGLTVSQCRVNDSECPTSLDLSAQIVKAVGRRQQSSPCSYSQEREIQRLWSASTLGDPSCLDLAKGRRAVHMVPQ